MNNKGATGMKYLPCIPSMKFCPTGVKVIYSTINIKREELKNTKSGTIF
jgi:hypothetical protein